MTFSQKILVQLTGDFTLSFLGFLTTILIARFFGSSTLGVIGFAMGILGIFAAFLDLGFGTAHIKKIAEGGNISQKISTYLSINVILTLVYSLILVIYFFIHLRTNNNFLKIGLPVFLIFYFFQISSNLAQVFLSTLQGQGKAVEYNLARVLPRLFKVILIVAALVAALTLTFLAFSYLVEGILILIFSIVLLGKLKLSRPSFSLFRNYFRFTFPIMVVTGVSYIFGNIDRVILGSFWDFKILGLYYGISQIANFPQQISSSVMTFFFPEITRVISLAKTSEIEKKCFLTIKYLLLIVTPILVLLILFQSQFINLVLGKDFLAGSSIFLIFIILAFWITIVRPFSNILIASEIHHILPLISGVNLVLLVILELILIPKEFLGFKTFGLGGLGAALANLIIWGVSGTFQILWVRKFLKIGIPKSIFVQVFAGFVFYFITLIISNYFRNLTGIILGALFGLFSYFALLYLLKELSKKDFDYFLKVIKVWTKS